MAIALTGAVTTIQFNAGTPSGQYTPPAGTTKLGIGVSYTDYDGRVSALALGASSATLITGADANNATNNEANATQYYIDSPSLTAQTVSPTSAATWKDFSVVFYPFSGAKTGMPTKVGIDAHDASTDLTKAMSPAVGDIVVAVASCDRAGTAFGTWANSFTSDLEVQSPNSLGRAAAAHKTAASTTETAQVSAGGSSASYSAAMSVVVYESAAGSSSAKLLTMLNNQAGF